MGCFSKLGLFILNFAIFAAGIAIVVLASLVISENSTYKEMLKQGMFSVPICILIAGLIIVLIGFLGCCGAMKENACMLKTYAFIVIVLLIAEIVLGILILVYPEETESTIKEEMNEVFMKYGGDDEALSKSIDHMQHDLECCGVNSFYDWASYEWGGGQNVSMSCCKEATDGCNKDIFPNNRTDGIYTQGCYDALKEDIQGTVIGLGVMTLLLALVQVIAISCACGLAKDPQYV